MSHAEPLLTPIGDAVQEFFQNLSSVHKALLVQDQFLLAALEGLKAQERGLAERELALAKREQKKWALCIGTWLSAGRIRFGTAHMQCALRVYKRAL